MNSRVTASIATAVAAAIIVIFLLLYHLRYNAPTPARSQTVEIATMEEYVEFLPLPATAPSEPSQAYMPEHQRNLSEAAPAGGVENTDAGSAGVSEPVVTSARPSKITKTISEPVKPKGPTKEERQQDEARRRARQGIADAFSPARNAADNTASSVVRHGNSGGSDGITSAVNSSGSGSVGGGWIMPQYSKIPSTVTGRIDLRAIVGPDGIVADVRQTGGKAPAGTDAALVAKCIAEVKARRFTRSDDKAPDHAIATISYIFK